MIEKAQSSAAVVIPGRPQEAALPSSLLLWGLVGIVFLLTVSNGEPARISSGYYVALGAPFLILLRGIPDVLRAAESQPNRAIFYALLMFALGNLASTIVTPNEETIYALLERSLLPLLAYLTMVGLVLTEKDARTLVLALASGALLMFVRGLLAYYSEFGIPDLGTILWSRYDVVRIAGFEEATVGNVTHMGSYVALVLPSLIVALATQDHGKVAKGLLVATIVLGLCNLTLAGSRAGMIVLALLGAAIAFSLASRRTLVTLATVGALMGAGLWLAATAGGDTTIVERFAPQAAGRVDVSVVERLDSMLIGWNIFLDNFLFGVGPAMSQHFNVYGIPHQSVLHQLSELGVLGGLAFIWLNLVVLNAFRCSLRETRSPFRLLWLVGPAGWLIVGLFSGIVFNMSMALVWVGIANAMLAISGATVVAEPSPRPTLSLLAVYRGLLRA